MSLKRWTITPGSGFNRVVTSKKNAPNLNSAHCNEAIILINTPHSAKARDWS
jgi:hypothetical protein